MLKPFICFFFVLCLFNLDVSATEASSNLRKGDLFKSFPVTETRTLSDGLQVGIPLHIQNGRGAVLVGFADAEKVDLALGADGFKAARITPRQTLIYFYFMEYLESGLGGYRELVVEFSSIPLSMSNSWVRWFPKMGSILTVFFPFSWSQFDNLHHHYPVFSHKLFVTSNAAKIAGIEIWGFPKELGTIQMNQNGGSLDFQVYDSKSQEVLSAYRNGKLPFSIPLHVDMRVVTPKLYLQKSTRGIAQGRGWISPFNSKTDGLKFSDLSPYGRFLKTLSVKPLSWLRLHSTEAVFLRPNEIAPSRN